MDEYIITEDLRITEAREDDLVRICWYGIVDTEELNNSMKAHLDGFFIRCKANKIKKIECDFRNMDFLNSTGIRILISWLRESVSNSSFKVIIRFNKHNYWQSTSFPAIQMIIESIELKEENQESQT